MEVEGGGSPGARHSASRHLALSSSLPLPFLPLPFLLSRVLLRRRGTWCSPFSVSSPCSLIIIALTLPTSSILIITIALQEEGHLLTMNWPELIVTHS